MAGAARYCGGGRIRSKDTMRDEFLKPTEVIDWNHPDVLSKAKELSKNITDVNEISRRCFEWVRDSIQHSSDFQRNPVTCSASQVLRERTGYCYAKSHLLAAMLRANGIPAGFCYQRLSVRGDGSPYSLHGFNAIYLPKYGWYRVDSRGNKAGVDAQFTPPTERLAFDVTLPAERIFPEILADPLPDVVSALHNYSHWDELYENLPDWEQPALR
jgi:transglutaminase-like putative cysteine protease